METNPVELFEIPTDEDPSDNKENIVFKSLVGDPDRYIPLADHHQPPSETKEDIVLRSLIGDPNRHIPLADHQPPSNFSSEEKQPVSMYTLETRYQPIPAKVLPKTTDPRVYYIGSKQSEESSIMNEQISDRQTPNSIQPEQESMVPTAFLQPKIISQPIFYSIVGTKNARQDTQQSIPINEELARPTIYSFIDSSPRSTMDMIGNNLEAPVQVIDKSPTIYSVVASPRFSNSIDEPTNQYLQPSPNFYSIVGSPARTSRGVQVNTFDSEQPAPILYTIIDDTPIQPDRSNEKRPSTIERPIRTDPKIYTLSNKVDALNAQQQSVVKPALYALVDEPIPLSYETRAGPPATKKGPSPPTATIINTTNRRISRSLERKPELISDEMISYPVLKAKPHPVPKETKLPKSEAIFVPFDEDDRRTRLPPPPSQTNPKPYIISQSQPIPLSNYRTNKPYRERKYTNNPLPVTSHNHAVRKPRPPLYEPRYHVEKKYPYTTAQPTSLERYPINTKPRSGLWDHGYQTQTDDDEEYEQKMNKKKRNFKTARSRTPWITVW